MVSCEPPWQVIECSICEKARPGYEEEEVAAAKAQKGQATFAAPEAACKKQGRIDHLTETISVADLGRFLKNITLHGFMDVDDHFNLWIMDRWLQPRQNAMAAFLGTGAASAAPSVAQVLVGW